MVGLGDGVVHISSWGWCDDNGQRVLRDVATHRLWRCRATGREMWLMALPVATDHNEVFLAAYRVAGL